jgi:hypothetical protein
MTIRRKASTVSEFEPSIQITRRPGTRHKGGRSAISGGEVVLHCAARCAALRRGNRSCMIAAVSRPKRKADYPNSQDVGSAIGLCSLIRMKPLTMRISDHKNHQSRIGMPISAMLSTKPSVR